MLIPEVDIGRSSGSNQAIGMFAGLIGGILGFHEGKGKGVCLLRAYEGQRTIESVDAEWWQEEERMTEVYSAPRLAAGFLRPQRSGVQESVRNTEEQHFESPSSSNSRRQQQW